MKQEKDFHAASGYLALFLVILFVIACIFALIFLPPVSFKIAAGVVLLVTIFCMGGFKMILI
jgi:hypothetical protein